MARRFVRWLFSGEGSLQHRALRGGLWLLLGDVITRLGGLLKLAILGRLLAPEDFGLMGIALLLLKWLDYFTQTGFKDALIQKAGEIRPYLDTAWTVQLMRGTGSALVLLAAAPLAGWFFENPGAVPVVRAIALVTFFRGFNNPAVVYLRRDLDFRRDVFWRSSGVLAGVAVAIPIAIVFRSVWALVASVVVAQAVEAITSYGVTPYRPRLRFDRAKARELLDYGRWIFWGNAVAFFGLYIDSLGVGRWLGASALGFYQMAQQLAFLSTSQIGTHVHGVMFPAFSRMRERAEQAEALLQTVSVVSAVVVPLGCALAVFAAPLVRVVFGDRWLPATTSVRLLALAGVAAALVKVTSAALEASGRPDLPLRASVCQIVTMAALLYPLSTRWGIAGAAAAVALGGVLAFVVQLLAVSRGLALPLSRLLGALSRNAALGSLPFLLGGALLPTLPMPGAVGVACVAGIAYAAIVLAIAGPQLGFSLRAAAPASEGG
jgi:O-antigen/teichoic acid export membrane protein